MGKSIPFTKEQQLILDLAGKDSYINSNFYFTGGTALSYVYLYHRISEDLDFFSEQDFDQQLILDKITTWAQKSDFTLSSTSNERVRIFDLHFSDAGRLKVDFAFYPHPRVEKSISIKNTQIKVDSLLDISINKLVTVNQRTQVKDFVDLYFLLKKFTVWDLTEGVKLKFRIKLEPLIIASDFAKVEIFDYLPKMIKPLTLEELKSFFRQKAKEISGKVVI